MTTAVTVLIFLVLISLHEFGHFAAAKLSGVGVYEFSIGMGPAIFKKTKGATLYSVRILPIGGYCKLEGEDEESGSESAFTNQKLWKRFVVIAAGAVLNLILGFAIFFGLVATNDSIVTTTVQTLEERAYIADSGIRAGDKIVAVNGKKVRFYNDIAYYLDGEASGKEISVTVKRDGERLDFSFLLSLEREKYVYDENGVSVVTQINGKEKQSYVTFDAEMKERYADYAGKTMENERYIVGFVPEREQVDLKNTFSEAYCYTGFVVRLVFGAIGDLFSGDAGIEDFSGPVGVATAVDTAVHTKGYGVENVLNLVAMLTINLGVFNLLPLPALDGGRLFFLLIELIAGKPVPPEKEGLVHAAGMMLLLMFAALVMFFDIKKLF